MKKIKTNSHQIIKWTAILGLLTSHLISAGWFPFEESPIIAWLDPAWEIGSYILIVFLVWWEWKNLALNHVNPLTLLILIIFPVLSKIILNYLYPTNVLAFPKILSFPFLITAGVLLFLVRHKEMDFRIGLRKDVTSFLICGGLGLSLVILESFIMIKFMGFPRNTFPGLIALVSPIYQLGYAAPLEECLFRGFLWRGLKDLKIKDFWILIIQASLFTLGHRFYLDSANGLLFLGMVFLFGLIAGIIVWRTRSLSSSISFHAFFNGSSFFLYWFESLIG